MIMNCVQCGAPVEDDMIDVCRVTPVEAQEFHGLKVGEVLCSYCMHVTKWPDTLDRPRADMEDGLTWSGDWDW